MISLIIACRDEYSRECPALVVEGTDQCDKDIRWRNGISGTLRQFCPASCNVCDDLLIDGNYLILQLLALNYFKTRQFHFKQPYQ